MFLLLESECSSISSNRPVPTPPTTVVPMPDPSSQATINNVGAIETSIKTMTQTVAPESPLPTTTSSSYSSAIIDINYVTDIVTTTTNGTTITVSSTLTANALTHTTAISAASTSTELSPVDTQPPSPTNISQSNPQHTKAVVIGAVLGTLLGVLLILTLILVYIRYRRRKYNSTASSIAFDREKMVSGHWWSSPRYTFGKRSHIDTRHESEPDDVSLAPSDSVSQLWSKGDPSDRLVPLRAPHFSEKVDGN
uniref:Mid2 domain-containing protein n=2 Tax=Moniliophthora roreri TaxID=221103 RepID=A0A0W0GE62_MONRR